jgi:hypothetical protein
MRFRAIAVASYAAAVALGVPGDGWASAVERSVVLDIVMLMTSVDPPPQRVVRVLHHVEMTASPDRTFAFQGEWPPGPPVEASGPLGAPRPIGKRAQVTVTSGPDFLAAIMERPTHAEHITVRLEGERCYAEVWFERKPGAPLFDFHRISGEVARMSAIRVSDIACRVAPAVS